MRSTRVILALSALAALAQLSFVPNISAAEPSGVFRTTSVGLIYTADTQGLIQPCGCSFSQRGGLAHRAKALEVIKARVGDWLLIDGGGLGAQRGLASVFVDAYSRMGYSVVGLDHSDLLNVEEAKQLAEGFRGKGIALLTGPGAADSWGHRCELAVDVKGVKVGFIYADASADDAGKWYGLVGDLILRASRNAHVVVVINRMGREWQQRLLEDYGPCIDVLLGGEENVAVANAQRAGSVLIPRTQVRGRGATLVEIGVRASGELDMEAHLEPIGEENGFDVEIQRLIDNYYRLRYRDFVFSLAARG